jgi:hypothetical protein
VGSNENNGTPATARRKTGDAELDALTERLRVDWVSRRAQDETTARDLSQRIIAQVCERLKVRRRFAEIPPRGRADGGPSEAQLAVHRAALRDAAEAARRNHARKHYKSADTLQAAVHEQCVAEYGGIMGFPYRDDDTYRLVYVSTVGSSAPWEDRARAIYTRLRKAIPFARDGR